MRYEFVCVDAGAPSCSGKARADTEEEMRQVIVAHLRKHKVTEPNETLVAHLLAVAEERGAKSAPRHAEVEQPEPAESAPDHA